MTAGPDPAPAASAVRPPPLAAAAPPAPRADLRRRLAAAALDTGACTPAHITAEGTLVRDSILLRVDRGDFAVEN